MSEHKGLMGMVVIWLLVNGFIFLMIGATIPMLIRVFLHDVPIVGITILVCVFLGISEFYHSNTFGYILVGIWLILGGFFPIVSYIMIPIVLFTMFYCDFKEMDKEKNNK